MNAFSNFFRNFGAGRLMVVLGVAMGVAATLAFTVFHVGSPPMSMLFTDVQPKEMSQITTQLDQQGVKYRLQGESTILVESDKVSRTRMDLEGKGLPTSASIGLEVFNSTSPLGQTDFMNNIQLQRATQGELERNIKSLRGVTEVHVLLNIPERKLFSDEPEESTASVTVGFSREPEGSEISAIQNLVAAATRVRVARVTVIDMAGKVLAGGEDGDGNAQVAAQETERALERAVRQMIEPVVGVGNIRVSVRADVDKAQTTTHDVRYDPDGQVLLSSGTSTNASRNGAAGGGAATANGNVNGGDGAGGGADGSSNDGESVNNNFQNSVKETTEITQPGKINKLTASVVINGVLAAEGAAAKPGEFTQAQLDDIKKSVANAIGYDQTRDGADAIAISAMKFATTAPASGGAAVKTGILAALQKADFMRIGEIAVLFVVALLTIFFVARPLVKGIGSGGGGGGLMPMPMLAGVGAGGGGDMQVLGSASGPMSAQLAYDPSGTSAGAAIAAAQAANPSIDIARIEGQVKVSAVKQVSEFVERHPDESVSILRSWLHEA